MSKTLSFTLVLVFAVNAKALVYGTNDIKEVYTSTRAQKLARSTATMVGEVYILPQTPKNSFSLDFAIAKESSSVGLCAEEKFSDQPAGWMNCTGFLVGEDTLVTTGHCVMFSHNGLQGIISNDVPPSVMCRTFGWVFDFALKGAGQPAQLQDISPDNVYHCASVLYAESLGDYQDPITGDFSNPPGGEHGTDFAIIKLDRKVVGREPLKFTSEIPQAGEKVMTIGYPSALPAKYAEGSVIPGNFINYFVTDLDIYGGNSGSPVFNSKDEVTGIVVRGFPYEDYNWLQDRQCNVSNVCEKIGEGTCVPSLPNEILGTHIQKAAIIQDHL